VKPVSKARRIFDWMAGLSLIALGIVGLVLPGLQGALLILGGLAILSSHSTLARRILDSLKSRFRQVRDHILKRERE
jgi:drug/metabolite transporter (DMT)-like permease